MLTVGFAVTVILNVLVQPLAVSVNVSTTVFALTPVTIPALVTVATPGDAEDQVPPELGVTVVKLPIHILDDAAKTVGLGFTVIFPVVEEQPVDVDVNVKFALPCAIPVITPAFVMVAIAVLELVQVPPVVGEIVVVLPTQIVGGDAVTVGLGTTVTGAVGAEEQPVLVCVHTKVTTPGVRPVTTP